MEFLIKLYGVTACVSLVFNMFGIAWFKKKHMEKGLFFYMFSICFTIVLSFVPFLNIALATNFMAEIINDEE